MARRMQGDIEIHDGEEEKVKSKDNCAKRIRKGNKNLSGNGGTGTGRGESMV